MSQPLPPHLQQNQHQSCTQTPTPTKSCPTRPPYGSGDTDDGYTLVFSNLAAFQEWRTREEETQIVEFVKGDTHGSKAVPPRFKDHTKLVCARHSRSGRKKYVKKHPERLRKVPSRKVSVRADTVLLTYVTHRKKKLDGQGCQASISYKTYFDTEEVRVCYVAEHSHPIGLANLPFTRRGRRAAVEAEKAKSKRNAQAVVPAATEASTSSSAVVAAQTPQPHVTAFPSNAPVAHLPHPFPHYPGQPGVNAPYPQMVPTTSAQNEQWERMTVLFNSVREHARAYDYPAPSVVALETVLVRLYLESPMGMMGGPGLGALGTSMHGIIPPPQQQQGRHLTP
ncbi:hypothetical protein JVT61DRAFT_5393 [Boletus reticuloceps]|uniref:Uncharacterized protein n=1 Tax=Boletus reticuloceps TaxID=495285 RepID=A0A8I2Z1C2_9AGAM|nr:hypothetical protein JVT61DRAFT_5393 [Boletus reticuloceps]